MPNYLKFENDIQQKSVYINGLKYFYPILLNATTL